jgi:nitroimidazol reductase NimA-like FMN-containing flavoprotein (pyridoxamine 5'-phosphate oxidase superfamily)
MVDDDGSMDATAEADVASAAIIGANRYLVLSTADERGRPWVSPVYFAADGGSRFFWVSRPGSTHSRNIAERPDVAIVVFDSSVPPGQTSAFFARGRAEEVPPGDVERIVEVFSRASVADGLDPWTVEMVTQPSEFRLYQVHATEASVLMPGREKDFRTPL